MTEGGQDWLYVLKDDKGKWMRNPQIITETYVKDGEIVYGDYKGGDEFKQARELVNNKLKMKLTI
jgi:6-oxo-cyclohex-1-ene-carbonyl-CoA hydrolase